MYKISKLILGQYFMQYINFVFFCLVKFFLQKDHLKSVSNEISKEKWEDDEKTVM